MAFRSVWTARCRRVPALETETPRTAASSALSSPAWNLRAISSRSRGGRVASAARRAARRQAASAASSAGAASTSAGSAASAALRLRRRSSSSAALRAMPNSQARSRCRARPCRCAGAGTRARTRSRSRPRPPSGRAAASRRRRTRRRARRGRAPRSRGRRGSGWSGGEGSTCWSRQYYDAAEHPSQMIRCWFCHVCGARSSSPCSLLALGAAVPAHAAERKLWATVNVCDTAAHPTRSASARRCRAGAHARRCACASASSTARPPAAAGAGSRPPTRAGRRSHARGARESGWSFEVAAADGRRILRGVVDYRWRAGARSCAARRAVTEVGHRSTAGADPAGFGAADLPGIG